MAVRRTTASPGSCSRSVASAGWAPSRKACRTDCSRWVRALMVSRPMVLRGRRACPRKAAVRRILLAGPPRAGSLPRRPAPASLRPRPVTPWRPLLRDPAVHGHRGLHHGGRARPGRRRGGRRRRLPHLRPRGRGDERVAAGIAALGAQRRRGERAVRGVARRPLPGAACRARRCRANRRALRPDLGGAARGLALRGRGACGAAIRRERRRCLPRSSPGGTWRSSRPERRRPSPRAARGSGAPGCRWGWAGSPRAGRSTGPSPSFGGAACATSSSRPAGTSTPPGTPRRTPLARGDPRPARPGRRALRLARRLRRRVLDDGRLGALLRRRREALPPRHRHPDLPSGHGQPPGERARAHGARGRDPREGDIHPRWGQTASRSPRGAGRRR